MLDADTEVIFRLTEAERNVLRGLERATVRHKNPSLAEIAEAMNPNMTVSGVAKVLRRLETKGYVKLAAPRRARGIRQLRPTPAKSSK